MRWQSVAATIAGVFVLCAGCSRPHSPSERFRDQIDHDFAASISATPAPLVFLVEVKRVNSSVDKKISGLSAEVDFVLKDASGRSLAASDRHAQMYAQDLDGAFERVRPHKGTHSLRGRVRLLTTKLKPGTYTIQPRVRIAEIGRDALPGPQVGEFTVAVPPANSVKVTVK